MKHAAATNEYKLIKWAKVVDWFQDARNITQKNSLPVFTVQSSKLLDYLERDRTILTTASYYNVLINKCNNLTVQ